MKRLARIYWLVLGRWLGAVLLALVTATPVSAQQPPKNFVLHDAPKSIPAIQFKDDQGRARSLADFHGKVVLLNIWATWCVPCRREMPALDRLQGILGGADFEVVALSMDHSGIEVVRKFYAEVGIQKLAMYIDSSGKATRELGAVGLPTTLLVDREGREIGRLIGPAEWDSPEIAEFIRCVISRDDAVQSWKKSKPAATPPCGRHSPDVSAGGTSSNSQP